MLLCWRSLSRLGHDPNDYEIGKRCSLPTINLMTKDGKMGDEAGPYAGQDRFECRENLWKDMDTAVSLGVYFFAYVEVFFVPGGIFR